MIYFFAAITGCYLIEWLHSFHCYYCSTHIGRSCRAYSIQHNKYVNWLNGLRLRLLTAWEMIAHEYSSISSSTGIKIKSKSRFVVQYRIH